MSRAEHPVPSQDQNFAFCLLLFIYLFLLFIYHILLLLKKKILWIVNLIHKYLYLLLKVLIIFYLLK